MPEKYEKYRKYLKDTPKSREGARKRAKEVKRLAAIKKAGGKKEYKRKKKSVAETKKMLRKKRSVPEGAEKMLKGLGRIKMKKSASTSLYKKYLEARKKKK